jgi:sugar phosphate isomerase/epimerase
MKLSLSIRIVEAPCKTRLLVPLEEVIQIAAECGYDAICMRASGVGTQTPPDELYRAGEWVRQAGLRVSMVTADFNVPLNNDHGPDGLRDIDPTLDVAGALECDLVRVCLQHPADIAAARSAVSGARKRGIRLAHQCHTASLFEQVGPMLQMVEQIDRSHFGLIYEPANLMLCGESYGADTLLRLKPHLMNVYFQNHRLDPRGPVELETFCLGPRRFHHLPLWEAGGVDYGLVFDGLRQIGYTGYLTIHQAEGIQTAGDARQFASRCARFLREMGA